MSTPPEEMRARTAALLSQCVLTLGEITDSLLELAEDLEKLAEALKQDVGSES